jgi:hypothetical protein
MNLNQHTWSIGDEAVFNADRFNGWQRPVPSLLVLSLQQIADYSTDTPWPGLCAASHSYSVRLGTTPMADTPTSPLAAGSSDDLLTALDEMLAFTPDAASSEAALAQLPLDTDYMADAFELPEVPNPYEQLQMPTAEAKTTAAVEQPPQRGKDARVAPYVKPMPRRRKRPKDELDYLRAKVTDLEEELSSLNQSAGRLSPTSDDDDEMFARWKQVAERQQEEANRTVVENLKLRAMLKGQLEIAQRLEAAIAEHQQEAATQAFAWNPVNMEVSVDAEEDEQHGSRPRAASIADEVLFAELNGSLEEQYAQTDALLGTSGIAYVNHEMLSKIQLKQDQSGISFGHKEVRLLPFAMNAVARVMWSFLLYENEQLPGHVQTRVVNNDHLNATIVDTIQLPKSSCTTVVTRIAVRRYFEADRVVVVWSGCVEIAGSMFVRLRERGVNTVSSFDFLTGGSGSLEPGVSPPGCVLRAVIDVKPETVEFRTGADAQGHIGEMTDLVLGTYHRNFGMINQLMENLLLNELMGAPA